jgi:uncharacterized membrane protein
MRAENGLSYTQMGSPVCNPATIQSITEQKCTEYLMYAGTWAVELWEAQSDVEIRVVFHVGSVKRRTLGLG